jgi:hypothetical protein
MPKFQEFTTEGKLTKFWFSNKFLKFLKLFFKLQKWIFKNKEIIWHLNDEPENVLQ